MNNSNFIKMVTGMILLLVTFSLISVSTLFAQRDSRIVGEIICEVKNLSSEQETWTVTARCQSIYRWWWDNGDCYLTTGYSSASVTGTGNKESYYAFQSTCSPDYQHDLAFAVYSFTFDLPAGYIDGSFDLDLRDADWTANYSSPVDIWIRYNANTGTFD
jgi:hypothetical protein